MNMVHFAMRRPLTVIVAIVAIFMGAYLALTKMPRDILPDLGVPVIYVAQPYGGMDPAQMEGFLTYYYEYHFLYITGIEHVESKSIQGVALVKLQFHPGTNMAQAMAETVGQVNRARAFMPTGTLPPFIMRFDTGSVPVGNLVFSSSTRTVPQIQDMALNLVRPLFATLPGVSAPPPFGGSQRSIVFRVDPDRLRAYNMTPDEVIAAISAANIVVPSGNVRIGDLIPMVPMNSIVSNIKDFDSVPIRTGSQQTVYLRDVGAIEDSSDIQTGFALINGRRTVYIPVTKRADASTLSVVSLVKSNIPNFQKVLPDDISVSYEFDQSPYVTNAIEELVTEGALGALLTGLMVLFFLRDWRSALIIVINIPISLLVAVLGLWVTNQTINIMTLGGMALAVGILVDEATVTIENIHTHLGQKKSLARAALDATSETTLPRLLAMLCILAVFIPAIFMTGAGRALFMPLALAVGFAMIASYILSSTFVPILATWLMHPHSHESGKPSIFDRIRSFYSRFLGLLVRFRIVVILLYLALCGGVIWGFGQQLGKEIFPTVDSGQFSLRLHGPSGTRIERTEVLALQSLDVIKKEVGNGPDGKDNIDISLGFVGVQPPSYPINTIYLWTGGPEEAVLQVALKSTAHIPIEELKERLRHRLAEAMPDVQFSFEPSDIVSRVMSLGAPTPIEIAVSGPNLAADQEFAEKIKQELSSIQSLRDVHFAQTLDYPTVEVALDRQRSGITGVTTAEVARSLIAATSSSRFVVPNYWADPNTGLGFQVQVEIPQARMNSLEEVRNIPVARKDGTGLLLRNLGSVTNGKRVGEYDRYNMQRMVTLNANISGEDLGRVASRVGEAMKRVGEPPAKVKATVRGQITPMEEMLGSLQNGLLLAVAVIFLLLAANFQSLRMAFIVVSTVPAVAAGVVLMLWLSHTTLNIESFMGTIMAVGVAVANAIMLVTFAERVRKSRDAAQSAIEGAASRLRPIIMTSIAMIAGMIPMSLGVGQGGQQTAPLGRAVIGGLAAATFATLFVLPAVFALIQGQSKYKSASLDPDDHQSEKFDNACSVPEVANQRV